MTYKHPKEYKGVRNQDMARLYVEENCLKCSEFCGRDHDFSECFQRGKNPERCPKPYKPASVYAADLYRLEVE